LQKAHDLDRREDLGSIPPDSRPVGACIVRSAVSKVFGVFGCMVKV
jgi:hypothetical protein